MKYLEDEDFIKKQLFNSEVQNVNKLLKRYFQIRENTKNE